MVCLGARQHDRYDFAGLLCYKNDDMSKNPQKKK